MPDTSSEPENVIVRPWLYQSLLSGPRSAEAVTRGGVASRLTLVVVVLDPSAFDHVHDTGVPPVSLEIVVAPQPLAVTPAGGDAHDTVTFAVCQAKQLDGPGEQDGIRGSGRRRRRGRIGEHEDGQRHEEKHERCSPSHQTPAPRPSAGSRR